MSLTWDITGCANHEELWEGDQAGITNAMIFATMGAGIGRITETNWPEFYARIRAGGYFGDEDDFTPETVHRYVGLHTNVGNETRAAWMRRVLNSRLNDDVREARRRVAAA